MRLNKLQGYLYHFFMIWTSFHDFVSLRQIFILCFSTALSLKVPTANSAVIVTSTIVTVVFTTFIFGGMTEPFLRFMQVKGEPKPVSHEVKARVVVCFHGMLLKVFQSTGKTVNISQIKTTLVRRYGFFKCVP